jgi:hypothetical protein
MKISRILALALMVNGTAAFGAGTLTVTKVSGRVQSGAHPVAIGQAISEGSTLVAAANSSLELKLADGGCLFVGRNASITISRHVISVEKGAILVESRSGIKVRSGVVSGFVKGLALWEHGTAVKVIAVNGCTRMSRDGHFADSALVAQGQMAFVAPNVETLAAVTPVDIDLGRLAHSSMLLKQFGQRDGAQRELLEKAVARQQSEMRNHSVSQTNLVIDGPSAYVAAAKVDLARGVSASTPSSAPVTRTNQPVLASAVPLGGRSQKILVWVPVSLPANSVSTPGVIGGTISGAVGFANATGGIGDGSQSFFATPVGSVTVVSGGLISVASTSTILSGEIFTSGATFTSGAGLTGGGTLTIGGSVFLNPPELSGYEDTVTNAVSKVGKSNGVSSSGRRHINARGFDPSGLRH